MSDLQSGITVGANSISGTLHYIDDYSSAYGSGEDSGNYLVLHVDVPDVSDVTYTMEVVGGIHGPTTLDEDQVNICRITSTSQKIKVTASKDGCETVEKVFDLTDLELEEE